MKAMHIPFLFFIISAILFLTITVRIDASEPPDNTELKTMIGELESTITDADERMVAHPKFLE
ncbi:MAG: hypothetical protein HON76_14965 [Candidatus Scalindua sp.]|nr:hypothetical protein [Candidatus Scalindua sp.]